MWRFLIFELAWRMVLIGILSMFSYYSIDLGGGGGLNVYRCLISLNFWRRLFPLVSNMILNVYFLWSLVWSSLSVLAARYPIGGEGGEGSPNSVPCDIFIYSILWSDLGPSWKGGYPTWERIIPCEDHMLSIAWPLFFYLAFPVPWYPCLLFIISVNPRFAINIPDFVAHDIFVNIYH